MRDACQKVSGNKRELAQRAFENLDTNKALHVDPPNVNLDNDHASNQEIPEIGELTSGWSSDQYLRPTLSHKDIEHYLLNSSHRTGDKGKMLCYRQFVCGYNFYNEHYIHKVMTNIVNDSCCYIHSKCFTSMKQGTYTQWILMTRQAPYLIHDKANCSCPAG
jgi:hypothetical protein